MLKLDSVSNLICQSFSNMSYKLNLKLATVNGNETAWKRSLDWVEEVPTLMIGISMASGRCGVGC